MSSLDTDVVASILRGVLGIAFIAHGYNHGFGAGGVDGTARWFASVGLRPPRLHAVVSTWLEIGAGIALLLGVLTPAACAALVGVMTTAAVTVHGRNGFFVFRDGYEYVLVTAAALTALATVGPGRISVDEALGTSLTGWEVGLTAALVGALGSAVMLAACWRPTRDG